MELFASIKIVNIINPNLGMTDGQIAVELFGDASPFKISLTGPINYPEMDANEPIHIFDGLSVGDYAIKIIDKQGCETILDYELKEFICDLVFTMTNINHAAYCSDNVQCGDQNIIGCTSDGNIEMLITSSNEYKVYLNGNYKGDNIIQIDGLKPGDYTIRIVNKSDESCFLIDEFQILYCKNYKFIENETLLSPDQPESKKRSTGFCEETSGNISSQFLTVETLIAQGATGGVCNGKIAFKILSNLNGYTYYIKNENNEKFYDVTSLTDLCSGNYCLVVDDGCEIKQFCHKIADCISEPVIIDPYLIIKPCENSDGGSIYTNATSGKAPFSFEWNNGITETDLENIPAGNYSVTVTDAYLCKATQDIILEDEPMSMNVEITVNPISNSSTEGEIAIEITGDDQRYEVYIDDEVGSLINGRATIFTFEEGGFYKVKIYNSKGCAFEEEVFIPSCSENSEDLFFSVNRSDPEAVCGQGFQEVNINIEEGMPPFKIIATNTPAQAGEDPDWKFETVVKEKGEYSRLFSVPEEKINFRIIDGCGQIMEETIRFCEFNCFQSSEVLSGNLIKIDVTSFLYFTVQEGCFDLCDKNISAIEGSCSKVIVQNQNAFKLTSNGLTIHPLLRDNPEALKIIWPNGENTFLGNDVYNDPFNGQPRLTFTGDRVWIAPSPGIYTIKVVWTRFGQDCELEFDVSFLEDGTETYGFHKEQSPFRDEPWSKAFYASYNCKNCIPSQNSNILTNLNDCKKGSYSSSSFKYFNFVPNDLANPCDGGGTFETWTYKNGELIETVLEVPENVAIDQTFAATVGTSGFGGEAFGIQSPNNTCRSGGYCLFDSQDLIGEKLPAPFVLAWCGTQTNEDHSQDPTIDPQNPTVLGIGDDPSEVINEEDCNNTFVEDDGCKIITYCETDNGTIPLREELGENLVICRSMSMSGNCASVRSRCNCQRITIQGQEFPRISNHPIFNCENTSLVTCAQYSIDADCTGPGIGLSGNFKDESNTPDYWFLNPINGKDLSKRKEVVYPNPFTNEVNIDFTTDKSTEIIISIVDVYGIVLYEDYKELIRGKNHFVFNQLSNVPNGIYYIVVKDETTLETEVKKVIKVTTK